MSQSAGEALEAAPGGPGPRPDPAAIADAVRQLRAKIAPDMDFTAASAAVRQLNKLRREGVKSAVSTKIAVLGSTTTTQLASFLNLFLFAHNIDAEIYEAPYGLVRQEILDPNAALYRFKPNFIFIATTRRDLGATPALADTREAVDQLIGETAGEWDMLWQTARERLDCQIIQNNFDPPPVRVFGAIETIYPGAPGYFIDGVNRELARRAPRWVSIHDLAGLAANVGRWNWGDDRFFHLAKLPCAPEHLALYAHGVAAIAAARLGRSRKCLVLDLDNTLWGGVIGDDGLAGINIGQGDAVGEAFAAFQSYAKALAARGVILAVCSKNEEANAREPFEKHSDMVLRLEDIACFVANWEDKAGNIRRIAQELNIGLDALVFADDNPAERDIVRQFVPEVAVPELPADPADYIRAIEKHRYFEMIAVSEEDLQRTEMYRANAQRREIAGGAADMDSFLRSLAMRGWIGPVGDLELDRTVQLIGKSNQFNLTTRRHSAADVQRMMESPDWITRVVKLADRFGDNGLISVLFARQEGDGLHIDTWLMSCRVLKRGVEQFLLNDLVAEARARGAARLIGEYIPTAKNALVENHYADLGFAPLAGGENGTTRWQYEIGPDWAPGAHHIAEEK
ncbi:MAG TPA: HAD-IIIC family phosphatase [Caulobacterales bacterium]|jgi:FkbH-like protein|nr:HAD-IIIC family phosphatase [Caulobacterales bacterium]